MQSSTTEIDANTIAYHFHEPLGVVGQIIPFNFPLLMAAWKLAPAAFGGYKMSGIGRENHQMMLEHDTQAKNLLVSYDPKPMGLF